jgi:hypothetical protein
LNNQRAVVRAAAFEITGREENSRCDIAREIEFVPSLASPACASLAGYLGEEFAVNR